MCLGEASNFACRVAGGEGGPLAKYPKSNCVLKLKQRGGLSIAASRDAFLGAFNLRRRAHAAACPFSM